MGDLSFCIARLSDLRASALRLNEDGDVVGFDADVWGQADALAAALGEPEPGLMDRLNDSGMSAWLHDPQWLLRWRQPETWEACCRLYAADVAERALNLHGGDVDPRSREAIRVARLHARGRASDAELEAARGAAWDAAADAARDAARAARDAARAARGAARGAARDAVWAARDAAWAVRDAARAARGAARAARGAAWDAAWDAAWAARDEERRIWRRLLQYAEHGPAAADMEWVDEPGG